MTFGGKSLIYFKTLDTRTSTPYLTIDFPVILTVTPISVADLSFYQALNCLLRVVGPFPICFIRRIVLLARSALGCCCDAAIRLDLSLILHVFAFIFLQIQYFYCVDPPVGSYAVVTTFTDRPTNQYRAWVRFRARVPLTGFLAMFRLGLPALCAS